MSHWITPHSASTRAPFDHSHSDQHYKINNNIFRAFHIRGWLLTHFGYCRSHVTHFPQWITLSSISMTCNYNLVGRIIIQMHKGETGRTGKSGVRTELFMPLKLRSPWWPPAFVPVTIAHRTNVTRILWRHVFTEGTTVLGFRPWLWFIYRRNISCLRNLNRRTKPLQNKPPSTRPLKTPIDGDRRS
jgi:hypothetical protein